MIGAVIARCRERVTELATSRLSTARDERDLVALVEATWAVIDDELARGRDAETPAPACGPGCASCCRVNVGTLAIEGAAVAARLRALAPAASARARAAALLSFHERVRWLEDRERTAERLVCPFLGEDLRCAVHPVRPLACRSVSSLDAAECRRALAGDVEEDEPAVVRMDLLQNALHVESLAALAEALAARGLDARCRDVSGMVAVFLDDPGLAAGYLAGDRVPLA